MKKILGILLVTILLTGCGKDNSVTALNKAVENLESIKSATVEFGIDFKMNQNGMKLEMPLALEMAYKQENDDTFMRMSILDNILVGKHDLYLTNINDESNIYMNSSLFVMIMNMVTGGEYSLDKEYWVKESIEDSQEDFNLNLDEFNKDDFNIDIEKVLSKDDIKLLEEKDGIAKYKITLSKDLMKKILKDEEELEELEELPEFSIELYYSIDTKNNVLTKFEADLTKAIKDLSTEEMDASMVEKLSIYIEIKDINSTEVTIPEGTKNAITMDELTSKFMQ